MPEGADSAAQLVYLTVAGGALVGVDPLTGTVRGSVSGATAGGSAGIYVVRGKVALGLDSGQGGEACRCASSRLACPYAPNGKERLNERELASWPAVPRGPAR